MPALKALAAQLLGWLTVAALFLAGALPSPSPLGLALMQGGFAAAASLLLKSDRWWMPIHICFFPALVVVSGLRLPPEWFFAGFLLLLLVYWSTFRTQVPLFLTNRATARMAAELIPENAALAVMDLGCGTGGLLRRLARRRPRSRFIGIEAAPLPWLMAWLATRGLSNCEVRRGDFWRHSLAGYDLVYAFLSPVPMARLWIKARAEMPPDSLLVSNSFPIPEMEAERIIQVADRRRTRLYVYRVPARKMAA